MIELTGMYRPLRCVRLGRGRTGQPSLPATTSKAKCDPVLIETVGQVTEVGEGERRVSRQLQLQSTESQIEAEMEEK